MRENIPKSPTSRRILDLLADAMHTSAECGCDPWQFAVELEPMVAIASITDVRYLVSQGLIQHAQETTTLASARRTFRAIGSLAFPPRTCFILITTEPKPRDRTRGSSSIGTRFEQSTPRWNRRERILSVDNHIIKRFQVPAPSQERILAAFEEEGWPNAIDDPLPPSNGQSCKQRLHNIINALNRSHLVSLLRFHGNGKGDGIGWSLILRSGGGYRKRRSKIQPS